MLCLNDSGCPKKIMMEKTNKSFPNDAVLNDDCKDENGHWIAPIGAKNENVEFIINLGCLQKVNIVQIKDLGKDMGGTKKFSIFVGEDSHGPWDLILASELNQTIESGCSGSKMHVFNIRYVKMSLKINTDS